LTPKLQEYLNSSLREIEKLWSMGTSVDQVRLIRLVERAIEVLEKGNKIAFAGNGGSAAEASHLAAEFTGKCLVDHRPWRAICLNESTTSITAIGNDYGFDDILLRQSQALMDQEDLLIALSTSGKSKNVQKLVRDATSRGIYTILWTGEAYDISLNPCNAMEVWKVQSKTTSRIQEVHLFWGHLLAELIEQSYV
jgi:D-sedoheptulose 7-phosphate isomerase